MILLYVSAKKTYFQDSSIFELTPSSGFSSRLYYQPLFGKGARAPQAREREGGIEPSPRAELQAAAESQIRDKPLM